MGKAPLFVRPPTDVERQALEDGLRSPDAFVLWRAQIILASAQGEQVGVIAPRVGFSRQGSCDGATDLHMASGKDVRVTSLRYNGGHAAVYTLTVAYDHTFFVGFA